MKKVNKKHYLSYAKNIYSQCGEDGIIEQLFKDLNIYEGVVVEFGAWDGIYLSNTCNLWKNNKFSSILIEGDSAKAFELQLLASKYPHVEFVNAYVSHEKDSDNCIDNILSRSKHYIDSNTYAMISIDIDSFDYYIFQSMEKYKPKVVIIETNTSYDVHTEYISTDSGCSLKSVNDLAISKGYTLVCHTGNAIFVRNDLLNMLPDSDYSIDNLYVRDPGIETQCIDLNGNRINDLYWMTPAYKSFIENSKKL